MNLTKITIITLLSIVITRFIPHPPNFTSLIAISFYIPLIFGIMYMPIVFLASLLQIFLLDFITYYFLHGVVL